MKSYDEIYRNVLRRRDEQIAKKRRRIAVMGSVLPMAAVSLAVVIGVAVLRDKQFSELGAASSGFDYTNAEVSTLTFLCGTKHIIYTSPSDKGGFTLWSHYDSSKLKPPAEVIDGRLIFTADGQHIDITDITNEQTPYIYETVNPETKLPDIFIVGGTPEDFGWIEQMMYDEYPTMPEHSHWLCDSDNIYVETEECVEYRDWCVNGANQLRQNPRYIGIYEIGDSSTVAAYSLNGYTASLRLIDITRKPGADDDIYLAWDNVITVTDPHGRIATVSVKTACELYGYFFERLPASHVKDSLKIYQIEYEGEPHYVLALRNYYTPPADDVHSYGVQDDTEKYFLIFFAIEEECFEDGQLRIYDGGSPSYPAPDYIIFANGELSSEGNTLIDYSVETSTTHYYEFHPDTFCFDWRYEKEY